MEKALVDYMRRTIPLKKTSRSRYCSPLALQACIFGLALPEKNTGLSDLLSSFPKNDMINPYIEYRWRKSCVSQNPNRGSILI